MGFDLSPSNKKLGSFHMGAFSWTWMLNAGVGLPVCDGPGYKPGMFVFVERNGSSIRYNDGVRVTSKESKEMAKLAGWIADYQDILNAQWLKLPEEERKRMEEDRSFMYTLPVRRDFVQLARKFSEWAQKSGGFKVH